MSQAKKYAPSEQVVARIGRYRVTRAVRGYNLQSQTGKEWKNKAFRVSREEALALLNEKRTY